MNNIYIYAGTGVVICFIMAVIIFVLLNNTRDIVSLNGIEAVERVEKVHRSTPEPMLFLPTAHEAMEVYRDKNGVYASEWHMLDMNFACGPYHITDESIRPEKSFVNVWKPKQCELNYEIQTAVVDAFTILARNSDGTIVYKITETGEPVSISSLYITKEQATSLIQKIIADDSVHDLLVDQDNIEENQYAWLIPYNTRLFLETEMVNKSLFGNIPYAVDKSNGDVYQFGNSSAEVDHLEEFASFKKGEESLVSESDRIQN